MDANNWIKKLDLTPHPEGGWYKETYRAKDMYLTKAGERNASTAIYFLLSGNQKSHFHKIKSDEQWFYHDGETLEIFMLEDNNLKVYLLGKNFESGESLHINIPAGRWFASKVKNELGFVLVSCTVAPGFDFLDFEMAKKEDLLVNNPQYSEIINTMCLK